MTLTEQIALYQQQTAEIKAAHPNINSVNWNIDNVPLDEMKALVDDKHKITVSHTGENAFIGLIYFTPDHCICNIGVYSKKIKVVTPELVEA